MSASDPEHNPRRIETRKAIAWREAAETHLDRATDALEAALGKCPPGSIERMELSTPIAEVRQMAMTLKQNVTTAEETIRREEELRRRRVLEALPGVEGKDG